MKHMDDSIWLVVYLPLWKMMEFVSWDDDIPNIWGKNVPNHQPGMFYGIFLDINGTQYRIFDQQLDMSENWQNRQVYKNKSIHKVVPSVSDMCWLKQKHLVH